MQQHWEEATAQSAADNEFIKPVGARPNRVKKSARREAEKEVRQKEELV